MHNVYEMGRVYVSISRCTLGINVFVKISGLV